MGLRNPAGFDTNAPMPSFEATIREVVRETPDTVTLLLEADVPHDYAAGQFLNIDPHRVPATRERAKALEVAKGKKERARAYSLASAPHEPWLAITVKEEPGGAFPPLLTPYLVREAKPGDLLPCTGFAGFYALPENIEPGTQIVHVCAGSGIAPNYGIIKDALHRELPVTHTLLYSNRRWEDVIYRRELGELAAKHPGKLQVVHALTRDDTGGEGTVCRERISPSLLKTYVRDWEKALFFVCGPSVTMHERSAARAKGEQPTPKFLECMKSLLTELGVPKQRLLYEGW